MARVERVLDVYERPYDPSHPVLRMDGSPRQLLRETRLPLPSKPGVLACYDYEFGRWGVCNLFSAAEPLAGKRIVQVTEHRTKQDWALFLAAIARRHSRATKITLGTDNRNTHTPGSLYEAFPPARAGALDPPPAGPNKEGLPPSPAKGTMGPMRVRPHARARKLAEHRRDRAQRPGTPVPGPAHRHRGGGLRRNRGLAASKGQRQIAHRLAVHRPGRPHQARAAIPDT